MPRKSSRTDQKASDAGPADSLLPSETSDAALTFSDTTAVEASSPQHHTSTRSKRPAESELLPESQLRLSSEGETVAVGPSDTASTSLASATVGGVIDSSLDDTISIAAVDPSGLDNTSSNNNIHNTLNEDGTTATPTMQHSNPAHSPGAESDRARLPSFSEVSGYSMRNNTGTPSYHPHQSPHQHGQGLGVSDARKYNIQGTSTQSGSPNIPGATRPDNPNALGAEYPSAYPQPSSPSGMPLMQGMPDPRYHPHPDAWRSAPHYQPMPGYALPPGLYAHPGQPMPSTAQQSDGTSTSGTPKPGDPSNTSTQPGQAGAMPYDPRVPPYGYPMYPQYGYVDAYGRHMYAPVGMHPGPFPRYDQPQEIGADGRMKRRRGNLPRHVTEILKEWFESHGSHPYPTEDEKQQLMIRTGLTISQISNWFINARRRNTNNVARNPESDAARYMPPPPQSN